MKSTGAWRRRDLHAEYCDELFSFLRFRPAQNSVKGEERKLKRGSVRNDVSVLAPDHLLLLLGLLLFCCFVVVDIAAANAAVALLLPHSIEISSVCLSLFDNSCTTKANVQ